MAVKASSDFAALLYHVLLVAYEERHNATKMIDVGSLMIRVALFPIEI